MFTECLTIFVIERLRNCTFFKKYLSFFKYLNFVNFYILTTSATIFIIKILKICISTLFARFQKISFTGFTIFLVGNEIKNNKKVNMKFFYTECNFGLKIVLEKKNFSVHISIT